MSVLIVVSISLMITLCAPSDLYSLSVALRLFDQSLYRNGRYLVPLLHKWKFKVNKTSDTALLADNNVADDIPFVYQHSLCIDLFKLRYFSKYSRSQSRFKKQINYSFVGKF